MPTVDVAVLSTRAGRGCFAVGVRVEVRRAPLHGGSSTGEQADGQILPREAAECEEPAPLAD